MDGRTVTFTVPGAPVPQPRARVAVRGGFPMAYTPDNGIVAYRQAIALAAATAGVHQLRGVLTVSVEAVFDRPKTHLSASGAVRKTAPPIPLRADWDNIGKGVCDAIFANDAYVSCGRCDKRYAVDGESAHTTVTVMEDQRYATAAKPAAVTNNF